VCVCLFFSLIIDVCSDMLDNTCDLNDSKFDGCKVIVQSYRYRNLILVYLLQKKHSSV